MLPINPYKDSHEITNKEKYKVNKTRTELYKMSTMPYLQRKLNDYSSKNNKVKIKYTKACMKNRNRGT